MHNRNEYVDIRAVTARDKHIEKLCEEVPLPNQFIGTTREAFTYLVRGRWRKQDAIYRKSVSDTMRSSDRFRLENNTITDNAMRDRLKQCGFREFMPGLWTRDDEFINSQMNPKPIKPNDV